MTGIARARLFGGACLAGLFFLIFAFGGVALTNLVGFVYPAYRSFKAVETPDSKDDKQWLTYWVVYGLLNIAERILSGFLAWVPFYFLLKLGFLVWLYHYKTLGATVLYQRARPYLLMLAGRTGFVPDAESKKASAPSADTLTVKVLAARDLPPMDPVAPEGSRCSPFCLVKLIPRGPRKPEGSEKVIYKTTVVMGSENPKWKNASYEIPLSRRDCLLQVVVMDKENFGNDSYIGEALVDLDDVDAKLSDWIALSDPDEKADWRAGAPMRGELQLMVSF